MMITLNLQYFGGRGGAGGKRSGEISTSTSTSVASSGAATREDLNHWSRMGASFATVISTDEDKANILKSIPVGAGFNATYKGEDYFELKKKYKSPGLKYSFKADVESGDGKVYNIFKDGNSAYRVEFDNGSEKTFKTPEAAIKAINKDTKKLKFAMSAFWKG